MPRWGTASLNNSIGFSVFSKIPKTRKTEELELLEYHHVGSLYKRIMQLVEKVRNDRERDRRRKEELRVIRDKITQKMRTAAKTSLEGWTIYGDSNSTSG